MRSARPTSTTASISNPCSIPATLVDRARRQRVRRAPSRNRAQAPGLRSRHSTQGSSWKALEPDPAAQQPLYRQRPRVRRARVCATGAAGRQHLRTIGLARATVVVGLKVAAHTMRLARLQDRRVVPAIAPSISMKPEQIHGSLLCVILRVDLASGPNRRRFEVPTTRKRIQLPKFNQEVYEQSWSMKPYNTITPIPRPFDLCPGFKESEDQYRTF